MSTENAVQLLHCSESGEEGSVTACGIVIGAATHGGPFLLSYPRDRFLASDDARVLPQGFVRCPACVKRLEGELGRLLRQTVDRRQVENMGATAAGAVDEAERMRARTLLDLVYEAAETSVNCGLKEAYVRTLVADTEAWKLLVRRDDLELMQSVFAAARRLASSVRSGDENTGAWWLRELSKLVGIPLKEETESRERVHRVLRILAPGRPPPQPTVPKPAGIGGQLPKR